MEDDVQSASAEGGHIFNDDPFGLKLADEAEIIKPQARAGPREGGPEPLAASSPCETNVLAGEATCDDVDGDRTSVVSGQSVSVRVDLGGRRIITKNKSHTARFNCTVSQI